MTIDASVVGRTYPRTRTYEVGREKIREFAIAIGDDNPLYFDVAAARALGHSDVLAPPTFAFVLTLEGWHLVMDDLGIDFAHVLHVDQRFVYHRPLVAGDVIHAGATIDSVRDRMGATFLVIRTDVSNDAEELVSSGYSTIMIRPPVAEALDSDPTS
jgi:acyl dehydratase